MDRISTQTLDGLQLVYPNLENSTAIFADLVHESNYRFVSDAPPTRAEHIERHRSGEFERSPQNPSMIWMYRLIKLNDKYIGTCEIGVFPDETHAELGIVIFSQYLKCGYGAAACALLIGEFQDRFPHFDLLASCSAQNVASMKLLTKLGFLLVSRSPEAEFIQGEWRDELNYKLGRKASL